VVGAVEDAAADFCCRPSRRNRKSFLQANPNRTDQAEHAGASAVAAADDDGVMVRGDGVSCADSDSWEMPQKALSMVQ
jgi:hypothetical protein